MVVEQGTLGAKDLLGGAVRYRVKDVGCKRIWLRGFLNCIRADCGSLSEWRK